MKRIFLILMATFIIAGCFDKSDERAIFEATTAVKTELAKLNEKEPCGKMRENKYLMFGDSAEKMIMQLCGNYYDVDKEITLTDVKIYRSDGVSVCGVVSGTSRACSRLGQRFYFNSGKNEYVDVKRTWSKSTSRTGDDIFKLSIELFNKQYNRFCK